MGRLTALGCVVVLALGLAACGGEEQYPPVPQAPQTPPAPQTPSNPPTQPVPLPSALQSVVSQIQLPLAGNVGMDLDGDGLVDNQIGRLLGELRDMLGLDLQATLDKQLAAGKAIVLYDLRARSLVNDSGVELRAYIGADLDGMPADNFSGGESFAVKGTPVGAGVMPAAIAASRLASTTPERGFVSLPFLSETTVLPLRLTRLQATVGPDGLREGFLAGAIPVTEAVDRLAPVLAAELDRLYKLPTVSPTMVQAFRALLDIDGDGTITDDELKASNAFGFLLHSADIDTDDDGTPDAISFGIGFRAVPCQILGVD